MWRYLFHTQIWNAIFGSESTRQESVNIRFHSNKFWATYSKEFGSTFYQMNHIQKCKDSCNRELIPQPMRQPRQPEFWFPQTWKISCILNPQGLGSEKSWIPVINGRLRVVLFSCWAFSTTLVVIFSKINWAIQSPCRARNWSST